MVSIASPMAYTMIHFDSVKDEKSYVKSEEQKISCYMLVSKTLLHVDDE